MSNRIDFRRIADAALRSAETLLREWLPQGKRDGHEWKALNPTRADSRLGSFSINLDSGAWADFATGDAGGDLISLHAYLHGVEQLAAARAIAAQLGMEGGQETKAPGGTPKDLGRRTDWVPVLPAPQDASEPPKAHLKRGRPHSSWRYLDAAGKLLGIVYRFTTSDGGKEVLPCCFAEHRATHAREWRWMAFPERRPLYGLDALAMRPEAQVLVVEGEKCADAARELLRGAPVAVTWPGGSKAVDKADWTPLRGRRVILWPDCDAQVDKAGQLLPEPQQPGVRAMERVAAILTELGCEVRIVAIPAPGAKPSGWDVADAIAEGWNSEQLRAFIKDHLRLPVATNGEVRAAEAALTGEDWRRDLVRGGNGALLACQANAFLVLSHRPEWRDVLAYDAFAARPVKRMPPPYERGVAGDWEEMDDSFAAFWLATRAGLARLSTPAAAEAAEMVARMAPFDPVRAYLESLKWDGIERCASWLSDLMGVPESPYAALVGRLWLIGMVRRVFEPGCKFDYMPILEGGQGRGKSSALEVLAGPWFGNTDFVMGDKDSMAVMQGKWLYEVAELDSFNKADITRVKSFVTRQVDEFRPAYGRRILRLPRRVVLVGTTNQHEYFKDATGNRRFWPLQCRDQIDLGGLAAIRDQLFAEAVQRYRNGERSYPSREEQATLINPEQERREIGDAWEEGIHRYVEKVDEISLARLELASTYDVLVHGLKIDAGKITREMTTRVGLIMRKLGWEKVERRDQQPRYVYKRPQKSAAVTSVVDQEADDALPI